MTREWKDLEFVMEISRWYFILLNIDGNDVAMRGARLSLHAPNQTHFRSQFNEIALSTMNCNIVNKRKFQIKFLVATNEHSSQIKEWIAKSPKVCTFINGLSQNLQREHIAPWTFYIISVVPRAIWFISLSFCVPFFSARSIGSLPFDENRRLLITLIAIGNLRPIIPKIDHNLMLSSKIKRRFTVHSPAMENWREKGIRWFLSTAHQQTIEQEKQRARGEQKRERTTKGIKRKSIFT